MRGTFGLLLHHVYCRSNTPRPPVTISPISPTNLHISDMALLRTHANIRKRDAAVRIAALRSTRQLAPETIGYRSERVRVGGGALGQADGAAATAADPGEPRLQERAGVGTAVLRCRQ